MIIARLPSHAARYEPRFPNYGRILRWGLHDHLLHYLDGTFTREKMSSDLLLVWIAKRWEEP
jgi:hypothetical protein